MIAARRGHADVVTELIAHGAEVGVANRNGKTALAAACSGGHRDIASKLLQHGADAHAAEVLWLACNHGNQVHTINNERCVSSLKSQSYLSISFLVVDAKHDGIQILANHHKHVKTEI